MLYTLTVFVVLLVVFHRIYSSPRDSNNQEEECRVLVLGGGGDRGAWQGGALKAIVEYIDARYSIVSGTSIGAINAGIFSQTKIGDEVKGAAFVENFWKTIHRDEIYTNWIPGGVAEGFFTKPALFNTDVAIQHTFFKYLNLSMFRESDRITYFGSTDLETGLFVNFNHSVKDLPLAVAASGAIPGLFPPILIDGRYHIDGGASANAPATLPIEKCKEYFPGKKITVDLIYSLGRIKTPDFLKNNMLTPYVLLQAGLGVVNDILLNDLQYAEEAFPDVDVNVYIPDGHLESLIINFDHNEMVKMFEIGYNEAKAKIVGEGLANR